MRSGKNRLPIANKPQKKTTLKLPPALSKGTTVNNTIESEPFLPPRTVTSKLFPFLKDPMAALYIIPDDASALPSPIIPIKRSTALETSGVATAGADPRGVPRRPQRLTVSRERLRQMPGD
ncbi:hypothetical protein NDU88_003097 [Pleurodeles waltl]|uniref:Uncharacterized protein n=1 Tax=Pleurodeles waltl TaxID=8319 RepID=A0AAV7W580_PLEWA|nr:hypothetical protein NDU88_003097 [Pleurodeles waltl]